MSLSNQRTETNMIKLDFTIQEYYIVDTDSDIMQEINNRLEGNSNEVSEAIDFLNMGCREFSKDVFGYSIAYLVRQEIDAEECEND